MVGRFPMRGRDPYLCTVHSMLKGGKGRLETIQDPGVSGKQKAIQQLGMPLSRGRFKNMLQVAGRH